MSPIIHETVFEDIINTLKDGVDAVDDVNLSRSRNRKSIGKYSSITKAASELTLVTPVVCSSAVSPETAMMCTKAIERRNVSMYQMLFSAFSITNASDAITHLKQFHTNLDWDKMNLDNFIDTMDSLHEAVQYSYISSSMAAAIYENYIAGMNVVPEDDINESSIQRFKEVSVYGKKDIIAVQEAPYRWTDFTSPIDNVATYDDNGNLIKGKFSPGSSEWRDEMNGRKIENDMINQDIQNQLSADKNIETHRANKARETQSGKDYDQRADQFRTTHNLKKSQFNYDKERDKAQDTYRDARDRKMDQQQLDRMRQTASQMQRQQLTTQLLPSDVKKANEMQPSLMIVNFYCNDKDRDLNIAQQFVCGVKAKLYLADSDMIIDKIMTKNTNNDILLSLIKVSTGEISFAKDFLLAVDDAKIDTLAKSKRKSGSAIFRALEKRSLKSKLRRGLRTNNYYKNLAALIITQEEAEQLQKYNNVDIMNPRVITPIMDQLCLLYFIVVDETSEALHLLISGNDEYETYTFSSLEKEGGDSNYKKIVNLMTRVAR